jgi:Zn-dependent peptidase ImmA (M78 family)/transcriptional regulator with XRE-family HTH domain
MARAYNINPAILAWARESAGFSLEEAADRLGLTTSDRQTAVEKLTELESGEKFPTRAQLTKIASVYRRPLLTFYMTEPPIRGERGDDFRTLPGLVSSRDNAALDALLRDIRARQEMVRSLLEDDEETAPLAFVGSMQIADGVRAVVDSIARVLGFSRHDQIRPGRNGGADELFRELRARAEHAGIFVLLVGDLGSHHSAISESVFRGFVIADPIAPFVVINDQDAKAARPFTLLHELAHLWLGQSGVSGAPETVQPQTSIGRIEQFCNDVAGEFLLPSDGFRDRPQELDEDTKEAAHRVVSRLAHAWSVSEPMIAYKLQRLGWITPRIYRELAADYAARWALLRQRSRENNRENEGGPNYYTVKKFKLGDALIDVVRRTVRDNVLSHTKAAKVLGVKTSSVEPLIRTIERSRGAFSPEMRR